MFDTLCSLSFKVIWAATPLPALPIQKTALKREVFSAACRNICSISGISPLRRAPFIGAAEGHWSCCSGSHQRQKSQLNCISQQPDDHQAPSLRSLGHWVRLELYQQLNRGFAFPRLKVHMDFTEKLENEHGWTHCCSLRWA